MSQSDFLRKTLVDRIRHIYENGIFIADTLFNQYRVNLIVVNGDCFEMFVDPASLAIAYINPLDHGSVRMRRYNGLISRL